MLPKPRHLNSTYAAEYQDHTVVMAYRYRIPYPEEMFDLLEGLLDDGPRRILDVGCGLGDIARPFASRVEHIDAVDISEQMIRLGNELPGGKHPNLQWHCGQAENVDLEPPYSLITAGESLHWMNWEIVLPRFRSLLLEGRYLVLLHRMEISQPWTLSLNRLIVLYSNYHEYKRHDIVQELQIRNFLTVIGRKRTQPIKMTQPLEEYIESFHSRNGLSRERMVPADATKFDASVRALLSPFAKNGVLHLEIIGEMVWGIPMPQQQGAG